MLWTLLLPIALAERPSLEVRAGPETMVIRDNDGGRTYVEATAERPKGAFELRIDVDGDGSSEFTLTPTLLQNVNSRARYLNEAGPRNGRMPRFQRMELWPEGAPADAPPVAVVERVRHRQLQVSVDLDQDGIVDATAMAGFGW